MNANGVEPNPEPTPDVPISLSLSRPLEASDVVITSQEEALIGFSFVAWHLIYDNASTQIELSGLRTCTCIDRQPHELHAVNS